MNTKATVVLRRALWLLLVPAVLLTGCSLFRSEAQVPLDLDFTQVLPLEWKALGTWHVVNVDVDADVEYLLFFTYDNGQVGATVYDPQIGADVVGIADVSATPAPTTTVELVGVPLQSFGYYRPYRLLPSYWDYIYAGDVGQGFIAAPDQSGAITVHEVPRPVGAGSQTGEADGTPTAPTPTKELVIRGGSTHLTFAWWRDKQAGYGVTQLYAPGGFRGINWSQWIDAPELISSVLGLFPYVDYRARSLLCRELLYQRTQDGQETAPDAEAGERLAGDVTFGTVDKGIKFCLSVPDHPYYPEGVVLAYLLRGQEDSGLFGDSSRDHLTTDGVTVSQVDAELDLAQLQREIVEDIETYPTVGVAPGTIQAGSFTPTTAVCAELIDGEQPEQRRRLLFTLRYQPARLEERQPERWTISSVATAPRPVGEGSGSYCRSILEQVGP